MTTYDRDRPTLVRCPICEHCPRCRGTHRERCHLCAAVHDVDCPACNACGLCGGTHLVTPETRGEWIEDHKPEPPEAA